MNNWIICLLSISSIIKIAFSLNNLEWKEQTLSILLKWNTTNNPDYIQVLRRRNDTNYWEMIAQLNSTENQYEDEKAKVIYDYFYKIRFVTNNNIKVSNTIIGHRVQTCTAQGKVTLGYTKPASGIKLWAKDYNGKVRGSAISDRNGNFKIEHLPYYDIFSCQYTIYPYIDRVEYFPCDHEQYINAYFNEDVNYQYVGVICVMPKRKKE